MSQHDPSRPLRGTVIKYDDPYASTFPESPASARIDCNEIADEESFHEAWSAAMMFPGFYGRNMDAWIDCMSALRSRDGMTRFVLDPGQTLQVALTGAESFRRRLPALFNELVDCTVLVNQRYRETGEGPALALVFT